MNEPCVKPLIVKMDVHKREMDQQMVMLLGPESIVLEDEGKR
jgi:hypothetical protein